MSELAPLHFGAVRWEKSCPKVEFDRGVVNNFKTKLVTLEKNREVDVTLINPDPFSLWKAGAHAAEEYVNHDLRYVRLQYRRAGEVGMRNRLL